MYCVRTAYGPCDAVVFILRQCGVACVTTTSMRRSQANSSHSFKITDVDEPELKIFAMGLLRSLLQNESQMACNKTEAWQKHCSWPYCEKGAEQQPRRCLVRPWLDAERRFQYAHYFHLVEENCDWKTATPSEISPPPPPPMFDELLQSTSPR